MSNSTQNLSPGAARRIERAATESMVVTPYRNAPGMFVVYNTEGEEYVVDLVSGACTCPDQEYNVGVGECKHAYRVEMEAGMRDIPAEFGRCDAVLMREASLRFMRRKEERQIDREVARMNRGSIGDDPDRGVESELVADGGRDL